MAPLFLSHCRTLAKEESLGVINCQGPRKTVKAPQKADW